MYKGNANSAKGESRQQYNTPPSTMDPDRKSLRKLWT